MHACAPLSVCFFCIIAYVDPALSLRYHEIIKKNIYAITGILRFVILSYLYILVNT